MSAYILSSHLGMISVYWPPKTSSKWASGLSYRDNISSQCRILSEFVDLHPGHYWIIGGDFNVGIHRDLGPLNSMELILQPRIVRTRPVLHDADNWFTFPRGESYIDHIWLRPVSQPSTFPECKRFDPSLLNNPDLRSLDHWLVYVEIECQSHPHEDVLLRRHLNWRALRPHLLSLPIDLEEYDQFHLRIQEEMTRHSKLKNPFPLRLDLTTRRIADIRGLPASDQLRHRGELAHLEKYLERLKVKSHRYVESSIMQWVHNSSSLHARSWDIIKQTFHGPEDRSKLILRELWLPGSSSSTTSSPHAMANILADVLRNTFVPLPVRGTYACSTPANRLPDDVANSLNNPFSTQEIVTALSKLPNGKASGPDEVPNEVLKCLHPHTLREYVNKTWVDLAWPDHWFTGSCIPVLKSGLDHRDPNSYRPITLLNCDSKFFERLVLNRLSPALESNGVFSEAQAGFRPGRGTRDQVFTLTSCIQLSQQPNHPPLYVAFLDARKAFDKVSHDLLLGKLQRLGISGNTLAFLTAFLRNATRKVHCNDAFSDDFPVRCGVPQGAVLSPTLYNVFINDLLLDLENAASSHGYPLLNKNKSLGGRISVLAFADDLCLLSDSEDSLQFLLDICHHYAMTHGFEWNPSKSYVMKFGNPRALRSTMSSRSFSLSGQPLVSTDSFRYLGVTISSTTRPAGSPIRAIEASQSTSISHWSQFFTSRVSDAKKVAKVLMLKASRGQWLSPSLITNLLKALVRPVIEFGLESAVLPPEAFLEAEQLQCQFLCKTGRFPPQTNHSILLYEFGLLPLQQRHAQLALTYASHIATNHEVSRSTKQVLLCIIDHGPACMPWLKQILGWAKGHGDHGLFPYPFDPFAALLQEDPDVDDMFPTFSEVRKHISLSTATAYIGLLRKQISSNLRPVVEYFPPNHPMNSVGPASARSGRKSVVPSGPICNRPFFNLYHVNGGFYSVIANFLQRFPFSTVPFPHDNWLKLIRFAALRSHSLLEIRGLLAITRLRTGFCELRCLPYSNFVRAPPPQDLICQGCQEGNETFEHALFECSSINPEVRATFARRIRNFFSHPRDPWQGQILLGCTPRMRLYLILSSPCSNQEFLRKSLYHNLDWNESAELLLIIAGFIADVFINRPHTRFF